MKFFCNFRVPGLVKTSQQGSVTSTLYLLIILWRFWNYPLGSTIADQTKPGKNGGN